MSEELQPEPPHPIVRHPAQLEPVIQHIRQALVDLQFGEVKVIVRDGVVVQVERIERKRFFCGKR